MNRARAHVPTVFVCFVVTEVPSKRTSLAVIALGQEHVVQVRVLFFDVFLAVKEVLSRQTSLAAIGLAFV